MITDATVQLWGSEIGAVSWDEQRQLGVFQYHPKFAQSNIQLAPFAMPLREAAYQFPALRTDAFKGLPSVLRRTAALSERVKNVRTRTRRAGNGPPFSSATTQCWRF